MTTDQFARYVHYVKTSDLVSIGKAGIPKAQMARIRSKLKNQWFTNIMLKRKIAQIHEEVHEDYRVAEKRSIVDYVLMDPSERVRVNVPKVPRMFKPSIIRAPVPWRQSFLVSKQFCRHNLFITNPIVQRIRSTWEKRYTDLRFVTPAHLRTRNDNPLSPEEMRTKVLEQCENAKSILMNVRS